MDRRLRQRMCNMSAKQDPHTSETNTGLPLRQGKDAILTIVDQGCSRAAIFLPCSTTVTGPGVAQLYMDHVFQWFGLPRKIISDRDPRFTSHFGRALTAKLGLQQNLAPAFHPQTDGLSERKNQWVEQYLRLVTSAQPEDWTHWLPIASAVHNNRRNSTTNLSPNQILLGYDITLNPEVEFQSTNETVEERLETMKQKREQAIEALNETARKSGTPTAQYKKGQKVWLEGANLKMPHQKTKLLPKRYGPFTITKEVSPVAYQLGLPPTWTIHDVFHASLLSPYSETTAHGPNYSRPPPDLIAGEAEYEVEQIRSHRRHGRARTLQYLIKWKGYPESDNTWEPADQVHAPELVKAYHRQAPLTSIKAAVVRQLTGSIPHPGVLSVPASLSSLHHPQVPCLRTTSPLSSNPPTRPRALLLLPRHLLPISRCGAPTTIFPSAALHRAPVPPMPCYPTYAASPNTSSKSASTTTTTQTKPRSSTFTGSRGISSWGRPLCRSPPVPHPTRLVLTTTSTPSSSARSARGCSRPSNSTKIRAVSRRLASTTKSTAWGSRLWSIKAPSTVRRMGTSRTSTFPSSQSRSAVD